jgi:2Fe-2S iron-sulfur cluster binding domain
VSPQPFRNPTGGLIDRTRPITFTFDGRRLTGYHGDTLASALLANGVRLVGRPAASPHPAVPALDPVTAAP